MKWSQAWKRARPLLEGVERGRVAASEAGVELAFLDWGGEGELVVMLHANGFGAASFALVASGLRDRYRVIAVDVRGHGDSSPAPVASGVEGYAWSRLAADYVAALPGLLEWSGRDHVRLAVGHSLGGGLTLLAAAARPECIEEILLLDPAIMPPPSPDDPRPAGRGNMLTEMARRRRRRFPSREAAFEQFASRPLFQAFRPEALALYVAEGFREQGDEIVLKCDPEVEAAIFDAGSRVDIHGPAERVVAPTRLVRAERGDFSQAVYDGLAKRMPDARAVSCDAGHLFPMERPELVLEQIEQMEDGQAR